LNCNQDECNFNSIDWKEDGYCIANNTQLKTINLSYSGSCLGRSSELRYNLGEQGHNLPTRQQLQDFFSCIYQNNSIDTLKIESVFVDSKFGRDFIEGLCGHPSLTRLENSHGKLGSTGCTAIGKVLKHTQSLKSLRLRFCQLDDEGMKVLCDGLVGNSTIKDLSFNGNTNITPVGWRALSTILQHPNCKLIDLDLPYAGIDNVSLSILGSALRGSSIKALNLYNNQVINREGWQTLFNQLSQTTIEHLDLRNNSIEIGVLSLLGSIKSLKSVNLASNRSSTSTPSRWQSFFNSLQRSNTKLKKLDISYNHIGNEGAAALGNLLSTMSSLKTLELNGLAHTYAYNNVTLQGWQTLSGILHESNLDLVKLSFYNNNINDEGIHLLVRLVSSMTSLKYLNLGCNQLVTSTGWLALSDYLQSPEFVLRELHLDDNRHNDDTVVTFASALENNKTLKILNLYKELDSDSEDDEDGDDMITERGWGAVSSLLCNKKSILNTYNSNHTLQEVGTYHDEMNLPDDLLSYLELNENKDKVEVARQKILQTHFSDDTTSKIQKFLDIELEMMPAAIAWIGRPTPMGWKGAQVSGLSLMYNLMRRIPDLFDSNAQKKSTAKRKR